MNNVLDSDPEFSHFGAFHNWEYLCNTIVVHSLISEHYVHVNNDYLQCFREVSKIRKWHSHIHVPLSNTRHHQEQTQSTDSYTTQLK